MTLPKFDIFFLSLISNVAGSVQISYNHLEEGEGGQDLDYVGDKEVLVNN